MSKQMVVQSGCSGLTVTVVLAWSSDFPKTHICSSFASALKHWVDSESESESTSESGSDPGQQAGKTRQPQMVCATLAGPEAYNSSAN